MILTHYNLFISSTFKDMDVERDIIKFEVIPALNAIYNKKGVEIQAIDLRYGVNTTGMTEAEASEKVLNMCVNSIDRSRPFFVGFIGNRYGWIPSEEQWQEFYHHLGAKQKTLLANSMGLSITEIEILYSGLFSTQTTDSKYLFCFREDTPEVYLSNQELMEDESEEIHSKFLNMKCNIQKRCNELSNSSCFKYRLDVDQKNELYAPKLAQMLIEHIGAMIESEIETISLDSNKAPIWINEINECRSHFINIADQSVERDGEKYLEQLENNALIVGPSFSGKTTYLAQLYKHFLLEDLETRDDEPRKILLTARVNTSQYSRNIHQIMGRWIIELDMLLQIKRDDNLNRSLIEANPINHKAIENLFFQAVEIIRSVGYTIHIFIDDLDQFLISSPGDENLMWIDERIIVHATANIKSINDFKKSKFTASCTVVSINESVEDPYHTLLHSIEQQNFCELPHEICKKLVGDDKSELFAKHEDNPEYIVRHLNRTEYTFLHLNTFFKMVRMLNKEDFKKMRHNDKLEQAQIIELFNVLPNDYEKLMDFFAKFYVERNGNKTQYLQIIQLLKDYPAGLSVNQLMTYMDDKISAPEIYHMLYFFKDFISIEHDTERVKLRHHSKSLPSYLYRMEEIQRMADLYYVEDAIKFCCELVNEDVPIDITQTKQLIYKHPDIFNGKNVTSYLINAYLLKLYQESNVTIACVYAAKAINIAECMGKMMDKCRGHIYWETALMWKKAGNKKQAREDGAKAIDVFESSHAVFTDLPELYMMVGLLWEEDGQDTTAIQYYQGALKIMQFSEDYSENDIALLSDHIETLK